jgi:hypothetical protein
MGLVLAPIVAGLVLAATIPTGAPAAYRTPATACERYVGFADPTASPGFKMATCNIHYAGQRLTVAGEGYGYFLHSAEFSVYRITVTLKYGESVLLSCTSGFVEGPAKCAKSTLKTTAPINNGAILTCVVTAEARLTNAMTGIGSCSSSFFIRLIR